MKSLFNQQILPNFYNSTIEKKIDKIYDKQLAFKTKIPKLNDNEIKKQIFILENEIKNQLERKTKAEDKAKSLLFIISLSITAMTFSLNYLSTINNIISLALLFISIFYFLSASVIALKTMNVKKFHLIQSVISLDNEHIVLQHMPTDKMLLKEMVYTKHLNELLLLKITNLTYTSFILVRNGIILFGLFFIFTVVINKKPVLINPINKNKELGYSTPLAV